jgi:hypothetical protein
MAARAARAAFSRDAETWAAKVGGREIRGLEIRGLESF